MALKRMFVFLYAQTTFIFALMITVSLSLTKSDKYRKFQKTFKACLNTAGVMVIWSLYMYTDVWSSAGSSVAQYDIA